MSHKGICNWDLGLFQGLLQEGGEKKGTMMC